MPLRVTVRIARAYLEALVLGDRIKPFQAAKRRVFARYHILGTKYDRVFTAITYRMFRLLGIVDKIIAERIGRIDYPTPVMQALRLAVMVSQFDTVGDRVFSESLIENLARIIESEYPGMGELVVRLYKSLEKEPWSPSTKLEELEYRLLLPRILVEELQKLLPPGEVEEFAKAVNTDRPTLGFRVNRLKASVEEIIEELQYAGVDAWPSTRIPYHVSYKGSLNYSRFKPLLEGKVVPQDEASAAAGYLLGAKPGELIVDMCAAPGGKTTHLAELSALGARIVAIDVFIDRLERLIELATRTGTWPSIYPVRSDAIFASRYVRDRVDRVLLDPPCTSTGALAKHPEARWRLTREAIVRHVGLQRRLLLEAVKLLKPGGLLLYTVCSVLPEEGEENIKWLLETVKGIEIVPLTGPYDPSPLLPGTMRAWPHRHGTTGFFYALLERKE
ncbi:RsmB/NOP family class I SAM-dependent RNA methyltransferase [Hyperthermus butylicus]|uniref:Methyltransferase B-rRNA small subunit n=1 Tax=Hyperthermus butylicus (strain DSM 5456 / JCM 9403 / PLM1-5) TaxID=415426 RepID=A2BK10_HYPBU|nr:RsmB/NOP family class I SAM-dependent RNA methyltransferase [Hyperthermus butylicus]ABM80321.1 Methyltransferase B - rRNA small subunit [Hyperthermus butylicus DSM 5456]